MGFLSWLFNLFGSSSGSAILSGKESKRRDDKEDEEIEEFVALDIN